MTFFRNQIYHIYNRGNNREKIFYSSDNYDYFITKIDKCFNDKAYKLAYCLMPNHFHILIQVNSDEKRLSRRIGTMLSSYTQALNNQTGKVGSLFQQNTKSKLIENVEYAKACFHYIHQNPLTAELVSSYYDWPYSSWIDYINPKSPVRNNITATSQVFKLLAIKNVEDFVEKSTKTIDYDKIKQVWK